MAEAAMEYDQATIGREQLARVVQAAMPGWEFLTEPKGFGWASHRHFRAQLTRGDRKTSVVIRRARSPEDFQVEWYLYRSVLPCLTIRTARLWGVLQAGDAEPGWMVLEDLGSAWVREDCREDREAFLRALGRLHGEGLELLRNNRLAGSPIPRYPHASSAYQEWQTLLNDNLADPLYGLEEWMLPLPEILRIRLSQQPMTLLHGDANDANAIRVPFEVALIDWESACIGPMSLDLGVRMETLESGDELQCYRRALDQATGRTWPENQIRLWADLGEGYNRLGWLCDYIEGTKQGAWPSPEWHQRHYEPCLDRLRQLRRRRADWWS
jgi:hypothetical protein